MALFGKFLSYWPLLVCYYFQFCTFMGFGLCVFLFLNFFFNFYLFVRFLRRLRNKRFRVQGVPGRSQGTWNRSQIILYGKKPLFNKKTNFKTLQIVRAMTDNSVLVNAMFTLLTNFNEQNGCKYAKINLKPISNIFLY